MKKSFVLIVLGVAAIGLWLLSRSDFNGFAFAQEKRDANQALPALEKPRVVVRKSKRELQVFDGDKLIKTFRVALGFAPTDDKEKQGDGRTPEGDYKIAVKNPKSRFYLSLGLNYPNEKDAARGLRDKLITQAEYDEIVAALNENRLPPQNTRLGGEIYIHGGGDAEDWTWGCVALENDQIKQLFDALPLQTPVLIEP